MSQNLATIKKLYTDEEYLDFERKTSEKHEFFDGEIIAMAGASREHNLISGNIFAGFHSSLSGGKCEVYINDMRVRMKKGRYGYPDVVVACDEPEFADDQFDVLLNPIVVVEVLSKSTRFRDKNEKLQTYQKMESIRECLLIEQETPRIEHYIKQTPKKWLLCIYEELDEKIILESINCELSLIEIYANIKFKEVIEE